MIFENLKVIFQDDLNGFMVPSVPVLEVSYQNSGNGSESRK